MPRLALLAGLLAIPALLHAQGAQPVLIYVTAPADAVVAVDGVPIKQTGPERRLITPPFEPGQKGNYTLTATFQKDGKTVVIEQTIAVEGGKVSNVDLTRGPTKVVELPNAKKKDEVAVTPKKEEPKKEEPKEPRLDVPYFPTPQNLVEEMLKLAGVKESDVVYDLGSGDGRVVITAADKFKAKKGVGVEISPKRVKLARENAEKAGVAGKVEIREADILKLTDLSDASVVTLYLLPEVNLKLRPLLQKTLKPGARVVSMDFDMGEWKPDRDIQVKDDTGKAHTLYVWTVKEKVVAKKEPEKKEPEKKKEEPKVVPKQEEPKAKVRLNAPREVLPANIVEEMLKLAGVKDGDVVYDLGNGDGRIPLAAVTKFKAKKAVAISLDAAHLADAKKAATDAKTEDRVELREGDVTKLDGVPDATVVCLYLFPEVNEKLQPMLQRTLKPGSRIVSHDFPLRDDWKPEKEITVKDPSGLEHTLYLWTIKK